ncbi:MAG: c-type cytochrome, partial [Gammaproteobacteria bacterium]|nr:c-type cytochrome [Gammaproteobacteria bacterium]
MALQPGPRAGSRGCAALLLCLAASTVAATSTGQVERGRYLVHAGGCISCHTADREGAVPLAGGRRLETPFGIFYSPNLTPDRKTGIGGWTDDDFRAALRHGRAPDGSPYYPVFPYPAYAGMNDADVLAIAAWLRSIPPIQSPVPPHDLPWYLRSRWLMLGWNLLYFDPQPFEADPARDADWNRGAYLVRHLGHCGECHTPRNVLGARDDACELAGNPDGPDGEKIPNIRQDRAGGIGRWTTEDLLLFLEMGMLPDGDFTGSSMSAVIDDNTSQLTADDRRAIAAYLKSLAAL